jgi:DNA-binding MarR family transcriptional regulator
VDFEQNGAAREEFNMVIKQLEDKGLIETQHDAWHRLLISITNTGKPLGLKFNEEAVAKHRRHYDSKL